MRRVAMTAVLALLALAGCGGDDSEEAEQTVRDFVRATNARDADKLCDELLTREFIERATLATGDNALDACKQQFREGRVRLGLGKIKRTEVDGDEATVTAEIEYQGERRDRPFRLKKEDGEWRYTGDTAD